MKYFAIIHKLLQRFHKNHLICVILISTIYDMIYYIYYVHNTTLYKLKYNNTISNIIIINLHSLK